MIIRRQIKEAEFILSKDEIGYVEVLDSFKTSKEINILTFNISAKSNELLNALKQLSEDVKVYVVTNIPQRWETYKSDAARKRAKDNINIYMKKLLPANFEAQVIPFFNFNNHAKILVTDNVAYIGSANYSDESKNNYESGFLVRDKEFISFLREAVFPLLISDSEPYFDNPLVELRIFILNIYFRLFYIVQALFTDGFYVEYIEDEEFYQTNIENFNVDIINLEKLESLMRELQETVNKIQDVFYSLDDEDVEFDDNVERLESIIDASKIDNVIDLIHCDSKIYNLCNFSYDNYYNEYLERVSILACSEKLGYYSQKACDKANEAFEELAESTQRDVDNLRSLLKSVLNEVFTLITELKILSNINYAIDNTSN